jgi:hypothetical protein
MASTQTTVGPWAHGIAGFAGVIMIVGGAFQALEGLAGIVHDKYLVVSPNYIYGFDITVWGVIHLLVGLGLLVIGVSLLRGKTWARIAGVIAAAVSAIVNFAWLPYSPWWAVILIVIDVLVIWALASYLRQPVPAADQDGQAAPQHNQAAAS